MNILDKTDKSLVILPVATNGEIPSKIERYGWASETHKPGEFRLIDKNQLNIDGRYQRDQTSANKVREIARKWDWLLFGTLSVIEREDGTLWVFDGGHRTRAAFFRSDVKRLPCMVHSVETVSEEARAFVGRNTMVSTVSALSRYNASVCGEEPIAMQVTEMLTRCGLTVGKQGATHSHTTVVCIGEITRIVEMNPVLAERCIMYLMTLGSDKPIPGNVLRGLFTLCERMKDRFDVINRYGEKLSRGGMRELEIKIRQFRAECGQGGSVVEAKALLAMINKGNKTKLDW